jgi:hypothetical protein
MGRGLTLPPRRKSRGIVFDAKPTDVSDTLNWCDENMSADDMLKLIDGLQKLVRKADAEDLESPAQRRDRALAGDSRRGPARPSADAVKSFNERYPTAARIKTAL